jgi:hypothetical protein
VRTLNEVIKSTVDFNPSPPNAASRPAAAVSGNGTSRQIQTLRRGASAEEVKLSFRTAPEADIKLKACLTACELEHSKVRLHALFLVCLCGSHLYPAFWVPFRAVGFVKGRMQDQVRVLCSVFSVPSLPTDLHAAHNHPVCSLQWMHTLCLLSHRKAKPIANIKAIIFFICPLYLSLSPLCTFRFSA